MCLGARHVREIMATSTLIALAAVVTLIAMLIGGYAFYVEQKNASRSRIDELDDEAFVNVDLDTAERETYDKMSEAHAEDPRRVSSDQLCGALLRRAMAVVPYIERVERDRPRLHRLSTHSYIPQSMLDEMEEAEALLEQEIKEVQADAERLRAGWGRAIYAQAYDIVRRQRASSGQEQPPPLAPQQQPQQQQAAQPSAPSATAQAPKAAAASAAPAKADADADASPPFSWSQTAEEVELSVRVPEGTRPKDVRVTFGVQSCTVKVGGEAAVLEGKLAYRVQPDECTWSLLGVGAVRKLQVTLFKQKPEEWRQLMADGGSTGGGAAG